MSLCIHNSVQWICESIGLTGINQFWEWFFRGSPLPPGSWSGNIVNRKPPRGGGSFRSKYAKDITMIFLFGLPLNNVISLYMHIYITIKCAFSDTVPTNKICHRASSEQRPRTRSRHEYKRLVQALFTIKCAILCLRHLDQTTRTPQICVNIVHVYAYMCWQHRSVLQKSPIKETIFCTCTIFT